MQSHDSKVANFDHHPDGFERTEWMPYSRHLPERRGWYEVCAWKGADIVRCYWNGSAWFSTVRLANQVNVGLWRGLTRTGHLAARRAAA